jgi:hypothetical protein
MAFRVDFRALSSVPAAIFECNQLNGPACALLFAARTLQFSSKYETGVRAIGAMAWEKSSSFLAMYRNNFTHIQIILYFCCVVLGRGKLRA